MTLDGFLDSMQVLREAMVVRGWALEELAREVTRDSDPFKLEHLCEERPVLAALALTDALGLLAEQVQARR